jgi:hypothetical protein
VSDLTPERREGIADLVDDVLAQTWAGGETPVGPSISSAFQRSVGQAKELARASVDLLAALAAAENHAATDRALIESQAKLLAEVRGKLADTKIVSLDHQGRAERAENRADRLEAALTEIIRLRETHQPWLEVARAALAGESGPAKATGHQFCQDTAWTYCLYPDGCPVGACEKRRQFTARLAGERETTA